MYLVHTDHGIHTNNLLLLGDRKTRLLYVWIRNVKKRKDTPYSLSLFQLDPLFAGRWLFGVGTKTFCFKKRQQRLLYLGAYYLLYSGVIVLGNKMCLAQALNNKKVLYAIKRHSSFVDSLQIVRQSCLLDRSAKTSFCNFMNIPKQSHF